MDENAELTFTSTVIYTGYGHQSTPYRTGAIFQPFVPSDVVTCNRPPIMCLECGAFLNMFCNINEENGSWACSICNFVNNPFHSFGRGQKDEELQLYPELSFPRVDFAESDFASLNTSHSVDLEHIRVFAFDSSACANLTDIDLFLKSALAALSPTARVCIMSFGRCINLLRLCGGDASQDTITSDAISGTCDCSHALRFLISHGEFLTPASNALVCSTRIASCLTCLVEDTTASKTTTRTTLHVLMRAIRAMGSHAMGPGVRALIVTARSIPLGMSTENNETAASTEGQAGSADRLSPYADLGRRMCIEWPHVWLDVLTVSLHAVRVDTLDALAGGSGGMVLASVYSLAAEELLATVRKNLSLPSSCFPLPFPDDGGRSGGALLSPHGGCTVEVRTSKGLMVDQVTGPISNIDALENNQTVLSELLDEMWGSSAGASAVEGALDGPRRMLGRLVDKEHLRHTLSAAAMASTTVSSSSVGEKVDAMRRELVGRCMESEFVCQCEVARMDPSMALSFVLEPTVDLVSEGHGMVQLVVRYAAASTNGSRQKVTRVHTVRLTGSEDVNMYLAQLDEDVWRAVVARDIVGDLHSSVGGVDVNGAGATGKEGAVDPLWTLIIADENVSITKEIDGLVKECASTLWRGRASGGGVGEWRDSREVRQKVSSICRTLFHLREGPLLLGPSANPQESYALRSRFLSYSPALSMGMVQAVLQVCDPSQCPPALLFPSPGSEKDSASDLEEWLIMALDDVPPDSMALVPNSIALVDMGDRLVVRLGREVGPKFDRLVDVAIVIARRRAGKRYPVPPCLLVRAGSPPERMLFARLNPCHRDTRDLLKLLVPSTALLSAEVLDDMIASMPYTDQLTYFQYISSVASKFAVAVEMGSVGGGTDVVYGDAPRSLTPMDRGGSNDSRDADGCKVVPPPPPPLDMHLHGSLPIVRDGKAHLPLPPSTTLQS